jgi:hypothetical protein
VLGALIGVSLIADTLVREGVIERERLVEPLAQAEKLARDGRFCSLSTWRRRLIERGFAAEAANEDYPNNNGS